MQQFKKLSYSSDVENFFNIDGKRVKIYQKSANYTQKCFQAFLLVTSDILGKFEYEIGCHVHQLHRKGNPPIKKG